MARYSEAKPSGFAFHLVEIPLANSPFGLQKGTPEQELQRQKDGGTPKKLIAGVRVFLNGEDIEVDRLAAAYSAAHGVSTYDDVHPICVKARMTYTVAAAYCDHTSDPVNPTLFFGDTIEEAAGVLFNDEKRNITPDTIAYLHEQYEVWRDKVHPQANTIADYELQTACKGTAENADFLLRMRPGLRLRFTHTLAVLCLNSGVMNSGVFSSSTPGGEKSSRSIKKAKKRRVARK